jgi:hypothetical protein
MRTILKSFQTKKALSFVQFEYGNIDSLDYISGPTALNQHFLIVTEESESGSVNTIKIKNFSTKFVFFSDGDILEGAKQNRVLNTSIYLAPDSIALVPVSCVEKGRWNYTKSSFTDSDYVASPPLRKEKNVNVYYCLVNEGKFNSDQSKVWDEVSKFQKKIKRYSRTSDFSESLKSIPDVINNFINEININEKANGVAIFFKDKLLSLDVFNRKDIFNEYFKKLVTSSSVEAYYMNSVFKTNEQDILKKTEELLIEYEISSKDEFDSVGVGKDLRFKTKTIMGSSLQYNAELVHLNVIEL